MAERNPRIPHSIESLLFVNRNGKYCGYKQELISDNIGADLREFLICAECMGISRKPRNWRGNTVCKMCAPEERRNIGDIEKRIEDKVEFLNAKCPLSGEGCGWKGKLREIEEHMEECDKVRVECQLECGNVLERESLEKHNREICPLRIKRCDYCNQEVQAKEENRHKGQCQYNPDTEVPCPYKELGCEAIVLRKNMNTHITENMTNHNKLMLYQLNQLRNKNVQQEIVNEQQRDIITAIETSATKKERELTKERKELAAQKNKAKRRWRVWGILALVAVGIGVILAAIIGIAVAASQGNNIKVNSEQIASNSAKIDFLKYSDYKYIVARGKVLSGIEWTNNVEKTGTFYGPTFDLGQCKLRLKAVVTNYGTAKRAIYYVERLKGEYDDSIDNCRITYSHISFGYLGATQPKYIYSYNSNTDLKVGGSRTIGVVYWRYANRKVVVKVYFDTVGT